jgi:hypothetical protein
VGSCFRAVKKRDVIPANAGMQFYFNAELAARNWIPAFAGMTL